MSRPASKAFLRALEKQRRVSSGIEPRATWRLLFSAAMAKAVVEGRKTVTRRLDRRLRKAQPGDLLLGKETWAVDRIYDGFPPSNVTGNPEGVYYLADGPKPGHAGKTRVSIHMPDWACRIRARIVSVREESLQSITEEDARAEGFSSEPVPGLLKGKPATMAFFEPRAWFVALWNGIHGAERGRSWEDNPSVVRVEFAPEASS